MEQYKAIPAGYMTVGEVAKKMGVTVRTLQYYDQQGLLSPSMESEGGRRLYTDKDVIVLHQILSMKHLGFSLDDIKNKLISLETPAEVAAALTEQAAAIRTKLDSLSESLQEVEALKAEVLHMQSVNFKKYADIVVNLQMKNEFYGLIKHFDDSTLDHIRSRFDKQSAPAMLATVKRLQDKAIALQAQGVLPQSEQGIAFAKEFWSMIDEFTGGDFTLLPKLMALPERMEADETDSSLDEWKKKQAAAAVFIEPALSAYFDTLPQPPLEVEP